MNERGPRDAVVRDVVRRCRVARIATVSGSGRPSVNPLYFAELGDELWLGTPDWTLAARNVRATGRASVLLQVEGAAGGVVVRATGPAEVRTDGRSVRRLDLAMLVRYVLRPGYLRDAFAHRRQLPLKRSYHEQSRGKGRSAAIVVRPERYEVLTTPG